VPRVRLHAAELRDLAAGLLRAAGAPTDAAATTADLLVRADLAGHGSHGVRLVGGYCDRCRSGRIDPTSRPTAERDDGSTVVLDARRGLGPVAGMAAVELAVDRARAHGVAVVTMRRSGDLGRLADYVERAAAQGMIAVLAANDSGANQVVAPHGSAEPRLATNPLAIGIPRPQPPHLVLDMSTSVVSHGTIELLKLAGEATPETWAVDDVLLPLGGAKGTGLGLVVDVLAGILSGAGFSGAPAVDDHQGVWILALDPARFLPPGRLEADVERLAQYVRSAPPASPGGEVLVSGEHARVAREAARDGAAIPRTLWDDLATRARFEDVHVPTPMTEELP
jgi:hydroxycarboxylate dehydrogenase B